MSPETKPDPVEQVATSEHASDDWDATTDPATTQPPSESEIDKGTPLDLHQLDVRSVAIARLVNGITCAIVGIVALVLGSILIWFLPFPWKLMVPLTWILLGALTALNVVWWPRWDHERWSYRVTNELLELRHGVVWHVIVTIPLSRLQHVDLHVGPIERKWGLASLQIHTAGTRDASHRIPGLDAEVASELRDRLIVATNRGVHERADA